MTQMGRILADFGLTTNYTNEHELTPVEMEDLYSFKFMAFK